MNQLPLNKNELPLIREMLTKYKQGYISGLIPGSNITFTPSGCRNKIVSSTGGGGGQIAFTKTKAEIDTLIAGNDLVAGAMYEITGVHPTLYDDGTTSGTTVYLRAISGSELEVQGMGKFYNPKYNQAVNGFGIWENKMYGTFSSISGTLDYIGKEAVTADNSATGILLADGMIQWVSGDWSTATSITGGTSGATANVVDFVSPSYAINDKVIWGGYSWTNVNGNIGASTDVLNLDSEWIKDVYDTTNYNIAYDLIEYDYANDWISRRYDAVADIDVVYTKREEAILSDNGFIYSAIAVQQYGNTLSLSTFTGIFNKKVINSYDESINFCGTRQYNLVFTEHSFQYNLVFGKNSSQSSLSFSNYSSQSYIVLNQNLYDNSTQQNLIFSNYSYQNNIIFGYNCLQLYMRFNNYSFQNNIIFENFAYQSNIEFLSNSLQYNLFLKTAYQKNVLFYVDSNVDFNNQTLNSNIENATFKTNVGVTIPDISSATYIYNTTLLKEIYTRPDGTLKLKFMNNSDVLEVVDIDD